MDPFLKKEWYDVKAPSMFIQRQVGKTLITRTQGTKVRSSGQAASWSVTSSDAAPRASMGGLSSLFITIALFVAAWGAVLRARRAQWLCSTGLRASAAWPGSPCQR